MIGLSDFWCEGIGISGDEAAVTWTYFQESHDCQSLQSFAHGRAANLKGLDELAFGRKTISRFEITGLNLRNDLLYHAFDEGNFAWSVEGDISHFRTHVLGTVLSPRAIRLRGVPVDTCGPSLYHRP